MIRRVVSGLRDTLRLLSPKVRADRAYTLGRRRLIADAARRALADGRWSPPAGFAEGYDERVVEYPWMLARLGSGDLLADVGSTLNNDEMLGLVRGRYRRVVILNPFRDDAWRSRDAAVRYVRADARRPAVRGLPLVTCLSVLEHVGCDNTRYGGTAGGAGAVEARAEAMRGLRSLLARDGRLLLTVPFGRAENHGWFMQLDGDAVRAAVAAFAPVRLTEHYYLHERGWREASAAECASASYGDGVPGARAVACLELAA